MFAIPRCVVLLVSLLEKAQWDGVGSPKIPSPVWTLLLNLSRPVSLDETRPVRSSLPAVVSDTASWKPVRVAQCD